MEEEMVTAGNLYIATSAGEEGRKNKKEREHQRLDTARVAGSSAVNQQKQANKVESVKAKEEKTAPVDHEKKTEEAEDKKLAAVQQVEDVVSRVLPKLLGENAGLPLVSQCPAPIPHIHRG